MERELLNIDMECQYRIRMIPSFQNANVTWQQMWWHGPSHQSIHWTPISINFIQTTLQLFVKEAWLNICLNKSKNNFSKNTPKSWQTEICRTLQIKPRNNSEKYLGLPLIINRITKDTFYGTITKTQNKILNWYNKFLSFVGRSTLINHVTNTLPNYTMNIYKLPKITINKINNINKKNLWNATKTTNKKSFLNWNMICQPKAFGGIGFRNLEFLNKAFLLKLAWHLLNDKKSTWAQLIKGKYFPKSSIMPASPPKNYHSANWKILCKISKLLKEYCHWIVGDGEEINVWEDKWIDNIVIKDYVLNIPSELTHLKVSDIID